MTPTCPCCRAPLDKPVPIEDLGRYCRPMMRRILGMLISGKPKSMKELAYRLYGGQVDGGPLTAHRCISVTISTHRLRLAEAGWAVISIGHRYRLVSLCEQAEMEAAE
jgi:hypothetical protein